MPNELVYAMSTMGKMTLDKFKRLLDSVYIPYSLEDSAKGIDIRQLVIRTLDSLGYCEFDFESGMVYMCPPGLARLPSTGLPKAVLVGARIPDLVERIRRAVKNEQDKARFITLPQRPLGAEIPPLICIEADSTDTLKRISSACGLLCELDSPANLMFASLSDSLEDVRSKMIFTPHGRNIRNLRFYDVRKLMFFSAGREENRCLTDYVDDVTNRHTYWYWDGQEAAAVDKAWGVFSVLADSNRGVLLYDNRLQRLAVPTLTPLPTLLARSLTLSTGIPQGIATTGDRGIAGIPPGYIVNVYRGIDNNIADLVAMKLGQKLYSCNLAEKPGGMIN